MNPRPSPTTPGAGQGRRGRPTPYRAARATSMPTEAMLNAGVEELALALPPDTDPIYTRNLCRIIWRVMSEKQSHSR